MIINPSNFSAKNINYTFKRWNGSQWVEFDDGRAMKSLAPGKSQKVKSTLVGESCTVWIWVEASGSFGNYRSKAFQVGEKWRPRK